MTLLLVRRTQVLAMKPLLLSLASGALLLSNSLFAEDTVPTGMLPENIAPLSYQLSLKIDPEKPRFSGTSTIALAVKKALNTFYLHGKDLTITKVELTNAQGNSIATTVNTTKVEGVLKVNSSQTLPVGKYQLTFTYNAPFNENLEGLHRIKDGEHYYAFTQMEAISARLAFPSFDEPRFKTPYDIELTIPEKLTAIANTPEIKTEKLPNGWKKITFATSKPLPTYLVAYAVGNFDVVNWQAMPKTVIRNHLVPLRGIATQGKGEKLKYALNETHEIVEALEDYFQIPYPYEKLDSLAVPDFAAGAMENAGAITYREQLLLLDESASIGQKRRSKSVQAHELAHQWFGNLVTPVWWNDIWLNEAFATWMAATALDRKWPDEQWRRQQMRSSKNVMNSDSIPSARKIRNPIETNSDIVTAFDGITYEKGAGVLFMIENFMGAENFRNGVQKYMHKYAWGNTTAIDFFETIASVLPQAKAKDVVKSFRDFVEQAGVPLLDIKTQCKNNQTQLSISQQRYAPLGTHFNQQTQWNIPACLRYEVNGEIKQYCKIIDKHQQQITLPEKTCADWLMPNSKAAGYYRFNMNSQSWKSLLKNLNKLDPLEANAVLDSMEASFNSGNLTVQEFINVIPATLTSDSWEVVTSGMGTLATLIGYADETDKVKLRKLAADLYRPILNKVGFIDNTELDKKDPIGTSKLRSSTINFMAFTAKDAQTRKKLTEMAIKYTGYQGDNKYHGDVVIPALRSTAMSVAVQELGQPFADMLLRRLKTATDGTERGRLISALIATEDEKLGEALINLSLTPDIRDNEKTQFLFGLINKKELDAIMWPWLTAHFDQLMADLPPNYQSYSPYLFLGECKTVKAERLNSFLKPRLNKLVGADRNFVKAQDFLKQCLAQKRHVIPQIKTLLAK